MNSGFSQGSVMILLFLRPFDPFIAVRLQRNLFVLGSYRHAFIIFFAPYEWM